MRFNKKFNLVLIASLSALSLAACQKNSEEIVTGNGISISRNAFNDKLKKAAGEQLVRQMVLTEIAKKELGEDRFNEIVKQATQQVIQSKASMGGEDKFKDALQKSGIASEEAYKETMINYQATQETFKKNINISDDELKEAYDNYTPASEISHILVDDEDKAKDLIKQLDEGASFQDLAKSNSKDTASVTKGGSLGKVEKGKMVKEFEDAASQLNDGEYTKEPVKTNYGYHIIKMDKKGQKGSFDEEKDKLKEKLQTEKLKNPDVLTQITRDLLKKYEIKVKDSDLKNALKDFTEQKKKEEKKDDAAKTDKPKADKSTDKKEEKK